MSRRAYALVVFLVVSGLCGVLVAGLLVPAALVASLTVRAAADQSGHIPAEIRTGTPAGRSELQFADGSHLAWFHDLDRVPVRLADVAPVMRQAQLAIENHRFYQQGPLDVKGLSRSLLGNLASNGEAGGGSGITQQYVKMLRIERARLEGDQDGIESAQERTLARKVQELRFAIALDKHLSKDQIFAGYLNLAYYGDGAYGVEAAALHYFRRHASQLTLPQAAMLAGIVKSPTAYNPVTHPAAAVQRRNVVLNRMVDVGMITAKQARVAKRPGFDRRLVQRIDSGCQASRHPFLCDAARRELLASPELGTSPASRRNSLYRGSLVVRTTVQPGVQRSAEQAVSDTVAATDPAIGVVSLAQPGTGRVLAMAQSRPNMSSKPGGTWYNYPLTTHDGGAEGYQAGSTFKAITLLAALEAGYGPATRYSSPAALQLDGRTYLSCDGPFTFTGSHRVGNLANQGFGSIDMAKATQDSVNTYYMQLAQDVGLCRIAQMADRLGVRRADGARLAGGADQVATLTLGPIEVAPCRSPMPTPPSPRTEGAATPPSSRASRGTGGPTTCRPIASRWSTPLSRTRPPPSSPPS